MNSKNHWNPINTRQYQELLWLNPTLSDEIKKTIDSIFIDYNWVFDKEKMFDNNGIIENEEIIIAQKYLKELLEKLENLTGESQHILVVIDDCFTNTALLIILKKILWKEWFLKYVKIVSIDYTQPSDDSYLEENLSINHSVIILWWSLSHVYNMDSSHYDGYLAKTIKEVSDDYHPKFLNKRFVWICFWQQFLANIIWTANKNSSWIIATIEWPSQFSPWNCIIQNLDFVNSVYSDLLKWLWNNGQNISFSSVFTRTGYVNFDLLKTKWKLWIIPLIKEEKNNGIVWWGSKNGNIFWVQFHPEVNLWKNTFYLKRKLKEIIPNKKDQDEVLDNFDVKEKIQKEIWEAFYTYTLLWYIQDIIQRYEKIDTMFDDKVKIVEAEYNNAVKKLLATTSKRVDYKVDENIAHYETSVNEWWINNIDKKSRLLMNYILDWKVNRWIDEISDILWINSLSNLIKKHKEQQKSKNYIIRDLWAGDGSTISELKNYFSDNDTLIYGTGDFIYFDLYSCIIKKTDFSQKIPDELIILFVEKVIAEFKKNDSKSIIEKVKQSIDTISFSKNDTIFQSSMTSKKTSMFECENQTGLSEFIQKNFEIYLPLLEELKKYVITNFYLLFSSSFQKIYISSFQDLYIEDEVISKIDFQFSIRATSHIWGREYMKVISDYFHNSAKPGSIYLDNGIHQSYTSIPRIKELHDVALDLAGSKFKLIYDTRTNYFSSVIITKDIAYDDNFFQEFLWKDSVIVSLKEAYKSTFFKLEYFIRNFIISNFKNQIVFWDYGTEIISTLKNIMEYLEKKDTSHIATLILDLVNYIATHYKNGGTSYNSIDISILNTYNIDGQTLMDIIWKEIYIPHWMNIHANRKY